MTDDTSPRRPPRRASSPVSQPGNGRAEEPAPSADAAAVGEPTIVESHEVPADTAVLHNPAEAAAADAGPAHRADAPVDAVDDRSAAEPAAEPPARESAGTAPAAVPVSSTREADVVRDGGEAPAAAAPAVPSEPVREPEPAPEPVREPEPAPRAESVTAVPVESAPPAETRRVEPVVEPEPVAEPEQTSIHEPRPEERDQPAFAAPAVAAVAPPVPTPTAPVTESDTAPVAAPPAPRTVYVESPVPPKKKGNRGFGLLMSILATLVYAAVWAGVAALIIALSTTGDGFSGSFGKFVISPAYWGPVLVFALALIVFSLIVNRGGWGWWIVGGFIVAVIVYFGYLGSALLTVATQITAADAGAFVSRVALTPLAIASAVVAREVPIWFGAAASARARKVKAKNAETKASFDREQAERKAEAERARAGYADAAS